MRRAEARELGFLSVESVCVVCGNRINRCLANWATVVCQKQELSTHWISLSLSYSQVELKNGVLVCGGGQNLCGTNEVGQ